MKFFIVASIQFAGFLIWPFLSIFVPFLVIGEALNVYRILYILIIKETFHQRSTLLYFWKVHFTNVLTRVFGSSDLSLLPESLFTQLRHLFCSQLAFYQLLDDSLSTGPRAIRCGRRKLDIRILQHLLYPLLLSHNRLDQLSLVSRKVP